MKHQPNWISFDGEKIDNPFFPVELCPALYELESETELGFSTAEQFVARRHRAVVDIERKYVLAMVTDEYKLVTNQEALELGRECFRTVFQRVDVEDMELFNTILPEKRSFCHMDLVHGGASYDYFDNDPWTPYLRVTNSYNRTKPLRFDVGFCRGACRNGLIFRAESIVFKRPHNRGAAKQLKEQFQLRRGTFAEMEKAFVESLKTLHHARLPRRFMWPLFCKVFGVKQPDENSTAQARLRFINLKKHVADLTATYFDKLGETSYSAMNVLTDYASRPKFEVGEKSRIHGLQIASGIWIEDFSNEVKKLDFSIAEYLGSHLELAT